MNTINKLIEIKDVFKSFRTSTQEIEIIKGITLEVNVGDFVIIFGPSGCGKSTLLNMSLGLEEPSKGLVNFLGENFYKGNEDYCSAIRKQNIGIVYQQSNWIKSLNVIENVAFPLILNGMSEADRSKKAEEVLAMVGMIDKANQIPTELSSGQQQRIALARALVTDPPLIVADEPTGNLDSTASEAVMELFKKFNQNKKTIIMVTHDLEYLKYASKVVNIADGKLVEIYQGGDSAINHFMISKRGIKPDTISENNQAKIDENGV